MAGFVTCRIKQSQASIHNERLDTRVFILDFRLWILDLGMRIADFELFLLASRNSRLRILDLRF